MIIETYLCYKRAIFFVMSAVSNYGEDILSA